MLRMFESISPSLHGTTTTMLVRAQKITTVTPVLLRCLSTNAVPDLRGLESRWAKMKEGDQLDVLDYLNDKQAESWRSLTLPEKKALYHIYFGEWGPRSKKPQTSMAARVIGGLGGGLLMIGLGVGLMNYASDLEKEQKLNNLSEKLQSKQQRELELKSRSEKKSWWRWW